MENQNQTIPSAPADLPPPYSAVVGNPPYGFVVQPPGVSFPTTEPGVYPHPKPAPSQGIYPHPNIPPPEVHGHVGAVMGPPQAIHVGMVVPAAVGSEPTTLTCYNCNKVVTSRVKYTTAWHTHLVAGSVCVMTMVCSLCCLGLIPYCLDTFKDAEHYCPNCNSFLGKSNKC